MIRRALELQEALNIYSLKLSKNGDEFDQETYDNDYLLKKKNGKHLRSSKNSSSHCFILPRSWKGMQICVKVEAKDPMDRSGKSYLC
jgi:hypothetical protein